MSEVAAPVCVAGMHRSGTSMVARMLMLAGLHLGSEDDLLPAGTDNPEGFWENRKFLGVNEEILEQLDAGWDCPPALQDGWWLDEQMTPSRLRARSVIEGMSTRRPWGWKDPRNCITLPFWLELVPDLRVVVCLRNPLEVAVSLHERNGMSYAYGLRLWHSHYERVLAAAPRSRRLVTHYDAYFPAAHAELARLVDFAQLRPHAGELDEAGAALSKPSRHSRFARQDLDAVGVSQAVEELYLRLCREAGWADDAERDGSAGTRAKPLGEETGAEKAGGTAVTPGPSGDGQQSGDVGAVDRGVVDYRLLLHRYHRRGGHIAILQRRVEELEAALGAARSDAHRLRGEAATSTADDELQASIYDLELTVAGLESRLGGAADGLDRRRLVRRAREAVRRALPRDARIVVAGDGDPALLDLFGRRAGTFPQGPDGRPPGPELVDDEHAIFHLEVLRARGEQFLLLPASAPSWLQRYGGFVEYAGRYPRVWADDATGVILDLRRPVNEFTEPPAVLLSDVLADFEYRCHRAPAVLDWRSGLDVADAISAVAVVTPPLDASRLPHLDESVDIVVIGSPEPLRLAEARRVATGAVVVADPGASPSHHAVKVEWKDGMTVDDRLSVSILISGGPTGPSSEPVIEALLASVPNSVGAEVRTSASPASPAAWNQAASASTQDVVVFVHGGSAPLGPWLPALVRPLQLHGDVAAVCGKLLSFDGALEAAGGLVDDDGRPSHYGQGEDPGLPPFNHTRDVDCCAGAVVAVRRGAYGEAGGLDEDYEALPSALADLSLTLRSAGHRLVYQPESTLVDLGLDGTLSAAGTEADGHRLRERWASDQPSLVEAVPG